MTTETDEGAGQDLRARPLSDEEWLALANNDVRPGPSELWQPSNGDRAKKVPSSAGGIVAQAIAAWPFILVCIIAWELISPVAASLVVSGFEKVGAGNAAFLDYLRPAQVETDIAMAQVEVLAANYTALGQSRANAIDQAYGWDTAIMQQQLNSTAQNQWMDRAGNQVASFGCLLEQLGGAPGGACDAKARQRQEMAEEFARLARENRGRLAADVMEEFPPVGELLSDEYRGVARRHGRELPQ